MIREHICERQNKADEAQNYFNKSVHMIEMNMEGDISDPETMVRREVA